jgi:uncharacterized membrane protein YebE (DUF533 family)
MDVRDNQKKSVVFEGIKGIASAIGVTFGIDVLMGNLKRESLKTETKRAGIVAVLLGTFNIYKAVKHNQEVNSHTQRLEQERTASITEISNPR